MRRPCAGPARVLRKTMIVQIDRGAWLALGFLDSACILESASLPPLLGEWRDGQKAFTLSATRMLAISSLKSTICSSGNRPAATARNSVMTASRLEDAAEFFSPGYARGTRAGLAACSVESRLPSDDASLASDRL